MSENDVRDELIATQRQLIKMQADAIAVLRAYLKAAHEAASKCAATTPPAPRKDVQA